VALLETWREDLADAPARRASDERWEQWASLEEQVVTWFSSRESGYLSRADRARILRWIGSSDLGIDAVDAVGWGLDVATAPTFASAWRDELFARGEARHVLSDGEPYPVPEARWNLPPGVPLASRPASLTRPEVGEFPHVRVHEEHGFRIVADFGMEKDLESVAAGLRRAVALHPNEDVGDFEFVWPSTHTVFPVRLRDPDGQAALVLDLVRRAIDARAQIVVLPELSTTPAIVEAVAALLDDSEDQHLVVAGSYHEGDGPEARNESIGLVPEGAARIRHLKVVQFSNDLGLSKPWKEGIAVGPLPEITVYHSDRFRVCVLTCKDFLDDGVLRAISRVAANVICVPAMSEKTESFETRARQQVANAQAVTVMANGPLCWRAAAVEPAAVFGQPVRDHPTLLSPDGRSMSAPGTSAFKLGASAAD
jgi:hypothetical protein